MKHRANRFANGILHSYPGSVLRKGKPTLPTVVGNSKAGAAKGFSASIDSRQAFLTPEAFSKRSGRGHQPLD